MPHQEVVSVPESALPPEPASSSPDDAAIAVAVEMWEQAGVEHWLPITGHSMKPLLREGDTVLVAHGTNDIRRGDVVVFRQEGALVAHRVLRMGEGDMGRTILTKGDSLRRFDTPVSTKQIVGRVLSIEHNGRHLRLDSSGWRAIGWLVAVATLAAAMLYRWLRALKRWVRPSPSTSQSI